MAMPTSISPVTPTPTVTPGGTCAVTGWTSSTIETGATWYRVETREQQVEITAREAGSRFYRDITSEIVIGPGKVRHEAVCDAVIRQRIGLDLPEDLNGLRVSNLRWQNHKAEWEGAAA